MNPSSRSRLIEHVSRERNDMCGRVRTGPTMRRGGGPGNRAGGYTVARTPAASGERPSAVTPVTEVLEGEAA
ncbi:hypothetical protein GCM10023196_034830 [Actinoallomurus vinaceus]|uniref:Uncharacterized protein n=1 Tax=Actinoallomurus vinaceus TaxID=1080074 RepID=A0ABP8UBY8_9ACTN